MSIVLWTTTTTFYCQLLKETSPVSCATSTADIRDGLEKDVMVCLDVPMQKNLSFMVEDAKVHSPGMKIDAAGKFVLFGVKSHKGLLGKRFRSLNHTCFGYDSGGP